MSAYYGTLSNERHKKRTMRGFRTAGLECKVGSYTLYAKVRIEHVDGRDQLSVVVVNNAGSQQYTLTDTDDPAAAQSPSRYTEAVERTARRAGMQGVWLT